MYVSNFFPKEPSFYEDGYHVTITQVNVRVTAHHLDIINLGEASDEDVNDDHGGGVSVVHPRGPDPGVIHLGVHQRVQYSFFHLPGSKMCHLPGIPIKQGLLHLGEIIFVLFFPNDQ